MELNYLRRGNVFYYVYKRFFLFLSRFFTSVSFFFNFYFNVFTSMPGTCWAASSGGGLMAPLPLPLPLKSVNLQQLSLVIRLNSTMRTEDERSAGAGGTSPANMSRHVTQHVTKGAAVAGHVMSQRRHSSRSTSGRRRKEPRR